jgi:hypothetical protein
MKIFFCAILLVVLLTGCSKEPTYCWYCIKKKRTTTQYGSIIRTTKDSVEFCDKTGKELLEIREQTEWSEVKTSALYGILIDKIELDCSFENWKHWLSWGAIERGEY